MFFEDLTPYRYLTRNPVERTCNIGWIEELGQFQPGASLPQISALLEEYYSDLIGNQTRGHHDCGLCGLSEVRLEYEHRRIILGAAELWIPGDNGQIFVAPDLVIHYLREHSYCPPAEFVAAVLRLPSTIVGWNGEAIADGLCGGQSDEQ